MVKIFFSILALIGVGSSSAGQIPQNSPNGDSGRTHRLVDLVSAARIAPAELAVETLVSLVEKGNSRDSQWRRDIIEESYRLSEEVRNPVRLIVVPVRGVPVDTHAGYLSYAHSLKLDRVSLRSRIIRQMLVIDKDRARQMVFEIGGKLDLKPLECSDTLVPEVSAIYAVVADVAKKSFSEKEVEEGVRGLFVAPWFENIESPVQIGPALDLLSQMQGSPAERHLLFSAFSRAIRKDFKDDRSFTFAVERDRLAAKIAKLVSGPDDPAGKADISSAFREFLVKNFRASRCRDNEIKNTEQIPAVVRDANFLFADKALTAEEILHTELTGEPKVVHYWRSAQARQLMRQFQDIRTQKERLNEFEDRIVELEAKVGAFLGNLSSWNPSDDETESSVFNQKCVLFGSLASTVPEGKMRRSVVGTYLRYLSNSPLQKESYIEWLYFTRRVASGFPDLFEQIAPELHNPSFAVMIAAKKKLSADEDRSSKPSQADRLHN